VNSLCRWLLLLVIAAMAMAAPQQPPGLSYIALMHVTVIDGTGAPPQSDVTVVIAGYRIAQIGKTATVSMPSKARIVDCRGKFLIPGLWDMHAHPDDPELWPVNPPAKEKESLLTLLIANGVTGIRDMGGDLKLLQGWRNRIGAETMIGPRIKACGPLLDGPKPMWPGSIAISNEEQARQAVRDLKKARADFVKVYSLLPREAYFAIADESKKLGIPFAGHVPDSVTPAEASDAGQASEEHLLQIVESCSDRDAVKKKLDQLHEAGASPIERRVAYIETMLATYDDKKAQALFAKFVKNNTWVTPTVVVWQNNASFENDYSKYAERMKYLPRYIREYWNPKNNAHLQNRSPERLAAEKKLVSKYLEVIGAMQRAGVKLMTGSDFGANPLLFPGWGVHDEMALLVKAGLTPMQAIQAATKNPTTFLGLNDSVGTIERGKIADLVLLGANPLEDINNTRKITAVIFGGRMFDRTTLNRMLESVANAQEKSSPPVADQELRQELLKRVDQDQAIRNELIEKGVVHPDHALEARMSDIDSSNTARMREIVKQFGWPGPELVGKDGTEAAFLLVQHADYAFQKEMLPLVRDAYRANKLSGQDYALLLDRVLVREGKPQVYGTQAKPFDQWKAKQPAFETIEDAANVDRRRAEVGLPPLADYARMLKQMYFPKDR
jgi:imidazolonepropionase-like amidohydrolase